MVITFFILFLLCLYNIKFSLADNIRLTDNNIVTTPPRTNYLSIDRTNSIKGIFILLIFISHAQKYIELNDSIMNTLYYKLNGFVIGQSVVAMFLFYSGYGVMFSICKKGDAYIKSIPSKRVLKVLLHFDIAILLYLILQLVLGKHFSISKILLSFTAWETIGNSNWYIFSILILYLITYFSFMLFKNNKTIALSMTFVLTVVMILVLRQFKEIWWYDTVIIYPIGMTYYFVRDKLERLFDKKPWVYWLSLFALCVLFILSLLKKSNFFVLELNHILFTFIVLFVTMKVQIHNKILCFFGKNLFSVYILQQLPMIAFSYLGVNNYPALFLLLCLATTVLISFPFNFILSRLDKAVFYNKK